MAFNSSCFLQKSRSPCKNVKFASDFDRICFHCFDLIKSSEQYTITSRNLLRCIWSVRQISWKFLYKSYFRNSQEMRARIKTHLLTLAKIVQFFSLAAFEFSTKINKQSLPLEVRNFKSLWSFVLAVLILSQDKKPETLHYVEVYHKMISHNNL